MVLPTEFQKAVTNFSRVLIAVLIPDKPITSHATSVKVQWHHLYCAPERVTQQVKIHILMQAQDESSTRYNVILRLLLKRYMCQSMLRKVCSFISTVTIYTLLLAEEIKSNITPPSHSAHHLSNSAGDRDNLRILKAVPTNRGMDGERCGTKDSDSVRESLRKVENYDEYQHISSTKSPPQSNSA
jgi:hypothetical protein